MSRASRMGLFLIILLASGLAACTTGSPTATPPQATSTIPVATAQATAPRLVGTPGTTPATPVAVATRATPPGTPASTPSSAATPVPVDNRGIIFGKVVSLGQLNLNTLTVPVTNSTDLVKSFSAKATIKVNAQQTIVAVGTIGDLLPKQMRALTLVAEAPVPATYESVQVNVATFTAEAATTPAATVAAKMTFAKPVLKPLGTSLTLDVDITNGDSVPHTVAIQALYLASGEVAGVATGGVNDLQPGETRTATLLLQGNAVNEPQFAIDEVGK